MSLADRVFRLTPKIMSPLWESGHGPPKASSCIPPVYKWAGLFDGTVCLQEIANHGRITYAGELT
jgi:hypothetical protein